MARSLRNSKSRSGNGCWKVSRLCPSSLCTRSTFFWSGEEFWIKGFQELVADGARTKVLVHHNRLKPFHTPQEAKNRTSVLRNSDQVPEPTPPERTRAHGSPPPNGDTDIEVSIPVRHNNSDHPAVDQSASVNEERRPLRERRTPSYLNDCEISSAWFINC